MIRDSIKALGTRFKTYFNQGNWIDSNAPGRLYSSARHMYWIPGTRLNWDRLTGDLWTCPAVQACLNIINRNIQQAPWTVFRVKGTEGGKPKQTPKVDHPLLDLLNRPNPIYDGQVLKECIAAALKTFGNAFVIMEKTNGQAVKELWWVPNGWVQPYTAPGNNMPMAVDFWRVSWGNKTVDIPPDRMIHLRLGSDPADPRMGISELASANRSVNTLQQIETYKPSILRNFGIIGKFISPKNNDVQIDPKEIKEKVDGQTQGDNVGSTLVVDFAADIEYPNSSPKDLDIGTMGDMPESNICALMGVPAQIVGIHAGRLSKTYANVKEAREQFWEDCLIPLLNLISCQMGYALLPQFAGTLSPEALEAYMAEYSLAFDYSDIRPLQPDLDALNTRELEVFKVGITTVAQFCANTFREEPDAAIAELYYSDLNAPPEPAPGEEAEQVPTTTTTVTTEGKSLWEERLEEEWREFERQAVFSGNGVHA